MAISPEVQAIANDMKKELAKVDQKLGVKPRKDKPTATPTKEAVFGAPWARKGENINTSRGYQFQRLIGVRAGILQKEDAKVEMEMHGRMMKMFVDDNGFNVTSDTITQNTGGVVMAPFGTELMSSRDVDPAFVREMKSLTIAGTANADPDEMEWIARKAYRSSGKTAQSWLDETLGGALVAPPEFGELIQLLRNKDALINAGCRVVPLPASGRLKYPRQTGATTGYWVGENAGISASNFLTGSLLLSAKKVAAIVTMPNELIRFASPASEAILRADMTKTLSLTLDKAGLEGVGSDNVPLGIINTPGIATVTPTNTGSTNVGGLLSPEDLYDFVSAVEANNAEFQGYIMRPELFYAFVGSRAGVYNGSAVVSNGQFTYTQMRELGQGFGKQLVGYPATTTPQVSQTIVKGSSANSTYVIGGQMDEIVMAMFGTIEFAQAFQGDTTFAQDQVVVRAILTADIGLRHAGALAVCNQILMSVGL